MIYVIQIQIIIIIH